MYLKLRQKLYSGFGLIALFSGLLVLAMLLTFLEIKASFSDFVRFSGQSRQVMELTRQVSELQRLALQFTVHGQASTAEHIQAIHRSIEQRFGDIGDHARYVPEMLRHLKLYMDTFGQLQTQKNRQHQLIDTEIWRLAAQTQQQLDLLVSRHSTGLALTNSLLRIENNAMRYFDSLDSHYLAALQNALQTLKRQLTVLNSQDTGDVRTALQQYQQTLLEAVQRTRGYLFLVNVVMSAEAYEMLYQANQAERYYHKRMADIEQQMLTRIRQIIEFVAATSALFLLLVLLLSIKISSTLTRPIQRLTATFNDLAGGSRTATIAHHPVKDEIGALTEAAAVFRERNRETEQLLRQAKTLTRDLERSNAEMEQFVYTVSHDLKSPLVTSMGFIGIIEKLLAKGDIDGARDKFQRVVKANRRMSQLIGDLLELSRVGRIETDTTWLNLNTLLADFAHTNSPQLQAAGARLHIVPDLPTIHAHESRILQVFENLLSNALKYAKNPAGIEIRIGYRETADAHLVSFQDNGPGIEPDYHQKIFGLFYRLDNDAEGTGIGLAVAAKVMKLHQGNIWVESIPGQGAIFYLQFPKTEGGLD
ncbi:MAG: HAMP domain-containing sensor histidine kinase [Methylococcales bacterium]|nr:HAMP domain-containing sensor histidine kinase [Methylococcales bacterium]